MKTILLSGTVVNFVTVILGASVGLLLRRGFPETVKNVLMTALALCTLYIGVDGVIGKAVQPLVLIVSMTLGTVLGTVLHLDDGLQALARRFENRFSAKAQSGTVAEGLISATLLFCVGAMTLVGAIQSGTVGNNDLLYTKSLLDFVSAVALASTLGIGVLLSAVPVLILEGGLTLLASLLQPILTEKMIVHLSAVGSLVIIALALNMLKLTKIKVVDLLPAVFLAIPLCLVL